MKKKQYNEYNEALLNRNKMLERKLKRLDIKYKQISCMYEASEKVRSFNELEKNVHYIYNNLILKTCPDIIILFDSNYSYVIGTHSAKKLFNGFDASNLPGLSLMELFSPVFGDKFARSLLCKCEDAFIKGEQYNYSDRAVDNDRSYYYDITISPVNGCDSTGKGVVLLMHDATELIDARDRAVAGDKAKSQFLAQMSHEIRTPMNAIKGLSNLLLLTELNDVQLEYIRNIVTAAESLLIIINDILDFSKIEANKLDIINASYNLDSLLTDISGIAYLRAADKSLCFYTEIEPQIPSSLYGDEGRIKQILLNLISNATKFTKQGCVKLSVTCNREGGHTWLNFYVSDTGIGIKESELNFLFEPFLQVNQNINKGIQGSGLGLTISKRLVGLMGGDIKVKSEYLKGSEFHFSIPQSVSIEDPIAVVRSNKPVHVLLFVDPLFLDNYSRMLTDLNIKFDCTVNSEEFYRLMSSKYTHLIYSYDYAKNSIDRVRHNFKSCKFIAIKNMRYSSKQQHTVDEISTFEPLLVTTLSKLLSDSLSVPVRNYLNQDTIGKYKLKNVNALLVDDNTINLLVGEAILREYGIRVDTAENGQVAVDKFKNKSYDIIFMDHMMPVMDGIQATQKIRELSERGRKVPIIALTANAVDNICQKYLDAGMNDFIIKPIDISELNRVIVEWFAPDKFIGSELTQEVKNLKNIPELSVDQGIIKYGGPAVYYNKIIDTRPKVVDTLSLLDYYNKEGDLLALQSELIKLEALFIGMEAKGPAAETRSMINILMGSNHDYYNNKWDNYLDNLFNFVIKLNLLENLV